MTAPNIIPFARFAQERRAFSKIYASKNPGGNPAQVGALADSRSRAQSAHGS